MEKPPINPMCRKWDAMQSNLYTPTSSSIPGFTSRLSGRCWLVLKVTNCVSGNRIHPCNKTNLTLNQWSVLLERLVDEGLQVPCECVCVCVSDSDIQAVLCSDRTTPDISTTASQHAQNHPSAIWHFLYWTRLKTLTLELWQSEALKQISVANNLFISQRGLGRG